MIWALLHYNISWFMYSLNIWIRLLTLRHLAIVPTHEWVKPYKIQYILQGPLLTAVEHSDLTMAPQGLDRSRRDLFPEQHKCFTWSFSAFIDPYTEVLWPLILILCQLSINSSYLTFLTSIRSFQIRTTGMAWTCRLGQAIIDTWQLPHN